eukprot:CAMPEP_0201716522 /NCGR_PEP_ID=MMETSP0593-20130828/2465_1 /ASSEMBLY_ACC=CAM_ASM_000672 /TAXON_ID=267983 /ORGANISM="Skeletonema japonicum, Strain CCMP2506" /LENGTH=285 /DNA_ID=CAMNT_0048206333 /DNA_START=67 /DNA_END=924 /DNA_ORIENTATION=-
MITEEEDETEFRPALIRKRTTTTNTTTSANNDRKDNIFSSMITVPEDNSTENTTTTAGRKVVAIDTIPMAETGSRVGQPMLDDSIRSGKTENSLVNKMKDVLNEEWWGGAVGGGKSSIGAGAGGLVEKSSEQPPIQTLLLSDHQLSSSGATTATTSMKKKRSNRTGKTDFIFGMVLLAVGFVVGGVFIHRDKVLMNMTSLLSSGSHSSKSQQQGQGQGQGGMRQLPIVQHQITYEERQRLYREQKQAGMLRPINGGGDKGKLGIDEQERLRFQQYQGYDQLERGE